MKSNGGLAVLVVTVATCVWNVSNFIDDFENSIGDLQDSVDSVWCLIIYL